MLSLVLRARVNRILNTVTSLLYAVTVVVSCVGEEWAYYLAGSVAEVTLLLAVARIS